MKYVNVWEQPQKYEYSAEKDKTFTLEKTAEHLKAAAENLISKTKPKF